jgi:MFS family permease
MTGSSLVLTVTALAGQGLASDKGLATLPIALQFIATTVTTIPASYLMRRFGRRAGFVSGALAGAAGAGICYAALMIGDFILFCAGSAVIGILNGFAIQYRFAAADCADEDTRSRAISFVLAGGVIAAFTGPNLARATAGLIPGIDFAGSFAALAVLQAVTIGLLVFTSIPRLTVVEQRESGRPLGEILASPVAITAMLAAIAGYSAMTLVMTATPLAVVGHNHGFDDAAFVIQWHVFAMFAPSFVTGHLIKRFGVHAVIATGALMILTCIAVNLTGTGMVQFTVALMALGIGWNFMFTGGTSLLTGLTERSEQAKVQGLNDLLMFGFVAMAALSAGKLNQAFGWDAVNLAAVPGVLAALATLTWLAFGRRRAAG